MPFNGSGTFVRNYSWVNDANGGVNISSTRMDADTDDIASGLSGCITRDGQSVITADLPMSGFKHTNVDDGTARTHYSSIGQIQDGGVLWAGTAGGTGDVITLALSPAIGAYVAGQRFAFIASAANTTTVTVNINSLGAKSLLKTYNTALASGDINTSQIVEIEYDGTQFQVVGGNVGVLSTSFPTFKSYREKLNAAGNISGATTINYSSGNHYSGTMTGNVTFSITNPPSSSVVGVLFVYLTQDATGSRTVTWPASVKWSFGITPTLTTTPAHRDEFAFITLDGGTTWTGRVAGLDYTV